MIRQSSRAHACRGPSSDKVFCVSPSQKCYMLTSFGQPQWAVVCLLLLPVTLLLSLCRYTSRQLCYCFGHLQAPSCRQPTKGDLKQLLHARFEFYTWPAAQSRLTVVLSLHI